MDNELARDGDAVRRALGADDTATFPTVVFPEQEGKVPAADGTLCDLCVGLPGRQDQVAVAPECGRGVGGRRVRRRRWQRSVTRRGGRRVQEDWICAGAGVGAAVDAHAGGSAHGRVSRGQTPLAVGAAGRGRRVGARGRTRGQGEGRGRRGRVRRGHVGRGRSLGRWAAHACRVNARLAEEVDPRLSSVCVPWLGEEVGGDGAVQVVVRGRAAEGGVGVAGDGVGVAARGGAVRVAARGGAVHVAARGGAVQVVAGGGAVHVRAGGRLERVTACTAACEVLVGRHRGGKRASARGERWGAVGRFTATCRHTLHLDTSASHGPWLVIRPARTITAARDGSVQHRRLVGAEPWLPWLWCCVVAVRRGSGWVPLVPADSKRMLRLAVRGQSRPARLRAMSDRRSGKGKAE